MNNPLQEYFRNKEIFVKLPTRGNWMKDKPNLSAEHEIGVRPMTIADEMKLNIPDTLYNGEAMFDMIKSIAPDIPEPKQLALPDIDVILLASRAATYDKKMNVESRCPHCESISEYEIDLPTVLNQINDNHNSIMIELQGGLTVCCKPNTLYAVSHLNTQKLKSSAILASISQDETKATEELKTVFKDNVEQIAAYRLASVQDGIDYIQTPEGEKVTDTQHILDWLGSVDLQTVNKIETEQQKLNGNGMPNEFDFTCSNSECGKQFKGSVSYNPTFFFSNN